MSDIHDFYEFGDELGQWVDSLRVSELWTQLTSFHRGEFSVVIRGTHKETGEPCAIKCIEKHDVDTSRLQTEVDILTQVEHPHIIYLKEVFDTPDTLYLVMEL